MKYYKTKKGKEISIYIDISVQELK